MDRPAFDPAELKIADRYRSAFGGNVPLFSYPVSIRENCDLLAKKRPMWESLGFSYDYILFAPRVNPDNVARAFIYDGTFVPGVTNKTGGLDMFGIEWEYVPTAGGSMVKPGDPFIEDACEIQEKVVWPDLDSWDWETSAKANETYLNSGRYNMCWLLNGWYERLISFMDFEGAAIALFDEDQKDYVKEFFEQLSEFYVRLLDRYLTYYPQIDGFYIHDDWGSQRDTFFSPDIAEEMIVPYMKTVTDFLHEKGKFAQLHSCGQLAKQVPNIIKAGWDSWCPQVVLDADDMYAKYGDKIILGFAPEGELTADSTDEQQREAARNFAERFCDPEKPTLLSAGGGQVYKDAFYEELYKQSRIRYAGGKQ
ncbi:MAG: methyltransferase [Oscillospiraceae bacterium]|nr:methyltransferase [Oscillospiraceae bacterium]